MVLVTDTAYGKDKDSLVKTIGGTPVVVPTKRLSSNDRWMHDMQDSLGQELSPKKLSASGKLNICKECEHYSKNLSLCKICKCIMILKVSLPNQQCPIGKW